MLLIQLTLAFTIVGHNMLGFVENVKLPITFNFMFAPNKETLETFLVKCEKFSTKKFEKKYIFIKYIFKNYNILVLFFSHIMYVTL